jgi:hypothetical protein
LEATGAIRSGHFHSGLPKWNHLQKFSELEFRAELLSPATVVSALSIGPRKTETNPTHSELTSRERPRIKAYLELNDGGFESGLITACLIFRDVFLSYLGNPLMFHNLLWLLSL